MSNPLVIYPDREVWLPLRYFGSVEYYAVMSAYGRSVVSLDERYNKRDKGVHRMDIHDVHGPLSLTVPVGRPCFETDGSRRHATWSDVPVSSHGSWWRVHRVALESSYGRTPFFEFYIDRFLPFFTHSELTKFQSIADYDIAITEVICEILGIDSPKVTVGNANDCGKSDFSLFETVMAALPVVPYWQVRNQEFGFIPHLSILDLIFSLGPESPLYLKRLIESLHFTKI